MGSTLEHGIYLPSEGEKNCYQGLAGNWNKVDGALGDIAELKQSIESKFTKEIVTELPTEDINPFCIYMILKTDPETDNIYDEWVYINNSWEYLGNTKVDMTQYYTKQEVNQLPAVASGVTATKVGNYDTHIANGDIHVTASDKTKWTNSANTHVLRLALSALTPSTSGNSFSNLDDSTALKVGDKVMDTAGVLFEVTAIDTQNSTFTIGTALVDLAIDSDVVHKSGNETVAGQKTLENLLPLKGEFLGTEASNNGRSLLYFLANRDTQDQSGIFLTKFRQNKAQGAMSGNDVAYLSFDCLENSVRTNNGLRINFLNFVNDIPQQFILWSAISERLLGAVGAPWSGVYATNYYYGSNNIEFSTKFVTTDTDQTISGVKSFSDNISTKKIISNVAQLQINARSNADSVAVIAGADASDGGGIWLYGKNSPNGSNCRLQIYNTSKSRYERVDLVGSQFLPAPSGELDCGSTSNKWKTFNGVEPSSLGMPDFNNGIDISSYITDLTGASNINKYTPPVNGWISIGISDAEFIELYVPTLLMGGTFTKSTANNNAQAFMPVVANKEVKIALKGSAVGWAKFFPCLGNV